ncbi:MAG: hypothetical protein JWR05_1937 [Mucilaginibacter sp.]|nr:hypothetical protein [Mucilaginibacter sp.]
MADENKISIDVNITDDGQKQLLKYINSFDQLRASVNQLSQPFNSFSNGLNTLDKSLAKYADSLNKINAQHEKFVTTGDQVNEKVTSASTSFALWIGVIDTFVVAIKGWQVALTGGLAIVTAFLPEIINFATALFKGKDAVNAMATNFKNLNEVMKASNKDAVTEVTRLQILYKSATDVNNTYDDRIKSVKQLKSEFPAHLKGIKDEDILNGNSKKSYDELTKSIFENAKSKAALNKMTDEANKMLDADFQIEKIKNANFNEKKRYEKEAAAAGNGSRGVGGRYPLEIYKKDSDERARIAIQEQEKIKKATQSSIEYLTKFAGGAKNIAKTLTNGNNDDGAADGKGGNGTPDYKATPANTELETREDSIKRMALLTLNGYAKEIEQTNQHFNNLIKAHKGNAATIRQLKQEQIATLASISKKFQNEDLKKLDEYEKELNKASRNAGKNAQELAIQQLVNERDAKNTEIDKTVQEAILNKAAIEEKINELTKLGKQKEAESLQAALQNEQTIIDKSNSIKLQIEAKYNADEKKLKEGFDTEKANKLLEKDKGQLQNGIEDAHNKGDWQAEFQQKQSLLDIEKKQAIDSAKARNESTAQIDREYKQKQQQLDKAKLDAQAENQKKYLKTTETLSNAVMSIFGKNTIASRVAFKAHQAAAAAQVIIDTKRSIMGIWTANAGLPLIGVPKAIAETAIVVAAGASSLASIIKQKPGFASGGQFVSDGRGALLPGYSPTDNTNAYLRSGEAIVVSEAMRNPWARNLVSAINVAHGGRDFSAPNTGRGYAIGGIFTDGGNANRYYNQPVNDIKDMANTLAYQMINNFPPIYVDVKDVNNQQNILAQTVNRVNL